MARKGDRVLVAEGWGKVFWEGTVKSGYGKKYRVGVALDSGEKVFVNGSKVLENETEAVRYAAKEAAGAAKAAVIAEARSCFDEKSKTVKHVGSGAYDDRFACTMKIVKSEKSDAELIAAMHAMEPAGNGWGVLRYSGGVSDVVIDREAGLVRYVSITMLVD